MSTEVQAVQGIKESKDVLAFVLAAVSAGEKIAADKKISMDDLPVLMGLFPLLGPALDGIAQVPAELKDLSSAEAAELIAMVAAQLAIGDEKAKDVAVKGMQAAYAVFEVVQAVKALKA